MMIEMLQIVSPSTKDKWKVVDGKIYISNVWARQTYINVNAIEQIIRHEVYEYICGTDVFTEILEIVFTSGNTHFFKMSYDRFKELTYEGTVVDNRT